MRRATLVGVIAKPEISTGRHTTHPPSLECWGFPMCWTGFPVDAQIVRVFIVYRLNISAERVENIA